MSKYRPVQSLGPLFDDPLVALVAPPDGETSADRNFREFHEKHPAVYDELVRLCKRAKARGRHRIGVKMLWEVLRWNLTVERIPGLPDPAEEFKLNNNYHSRYARLIMEVEPDLGDIFETRELKS